MRFRFGGSEIVISFLLFPFNFETWKTGGLETAVASVSESKEAARFVDSNEVLVAAAFVESKEVPAAIPFALP